MSEPMSILAEVRTLAEAMCESTANNEQVRRLEELLLGHPEAEAFYVQYLSQYAELARHFSALPSPVERSLRGRVEVSQPVNVSSHSSGKRWRSILWVGAAAAAAFVAIQVSLRPATPNQAAVQSNPEKVDDSVAVVLQAPGAAWDHSEPSPRVGAPLKPGRVKLRSGLAHLQFYSGATVILQGPAELLLISPNEAYCVRGKLRAYVPQQAQGFRIGSPQLNVVDRGTEFAMNVVEDEKTEVHVFQGKVDLYDVGADLNAAAKQALTTGQAVRMQGPEVSAIAADPTGFSSAADLAERQRQELRRRKEEWLAASESLRTDPSLVVFYTFQNTDSDAYGRTLLNQVTRQQHSQDGVIVCCQWVNGRWPGKQALDFKQVSDRVRFHVPGDFDSLTLAAWIRVDALPNRFNSLMMTDGWEANEPHWHISDSGQLELGVQGPNKKNGVHYFGPEVFTSDRFGKWSHVAVVYDRGTGEVTHYVDGEPVSRQPIKLNIPLRLGDVELGNWNIASHSHNTSPIRFFSGCIDEFMLFSRPLGDDEIKRMHRQGQPPQ